MPHGSDCAVTLPQNTAMKAASFLSNADTIRLLLELGEAAGEPTR